MVDMAYNILNDLHLKRQENENTIISALLLLLQTAPT